MTRVRLKKPDQASGGKRAESPQRTEVNKTVPVRETENAAPKSLLPLERESDCTHTYTHKSVLINVQGLILCLNCQPVRAISLWWAHIQGLREINGHRINETVALVQLRGQIITPSHLANQSYPACIYVNHSQKWIGMTGSLPIYCCYTFSIKPGPGHSSHGSEFSWLNHWVHTAVVTRKQQLIS